MNKIIISPSILSSDFSRLGEEIIMLETNGADWIHIDVMDGHFVPNITIGIPVVKSLKKVCNLPLDVHLMIEKPEKYINDFIIAGADIITFHYEAAKDKSRDLINQIHKGGKKAGISIKPNTKAKEIFNYLDIVDLVLIMTVEPGFGGQKFISDCAEKITEIKSEIKKEIIIEADGGINDITAKYCIEKGVNALVAGNYIFSNNNKRQAIELLRG